MRKSNLEILLLVEDEPDHAYLIMEALKDNGHLANEIIWVKNGKDAVDYVYNKGNYQRENASNPGLILLDIKLPDLDGFEVLNIIKSDDNYKSIPIVMLTTTRNSEDITKALKLGANDYIIKPIEWEDFDRKIRGLGKYWAFISDSNFSE